MRLSPKLAALSPVALFAASCGVAATGDNAATAATPATEAAAPFAITDVASFAEPWAMARDPRSGAIFVTEKRGAIRFVLPDGRLGTVGGVPTVDYGGQGGLGDIAFGPQGKGTVYLTWAEAGADDTRGAVLGRATLACATELSCTLEGLRVIWRQSPKVTGRGHYSHRIAFSPDGRHLFLASGDRQKMTPAQDTANNLGKVLRLDLDGKPAAGNPLAGHGGVAAEIWSWGHRNVLGLAFDAQGRLWDLEHGPAGGDEINLVEPGRNYGWPEASEGRHYDGRSIPNHAERPQFAAPAIHWTPVIAPGDFTFLAGTAFRDWRGQALVAGMVYPGLVRVAFDGGKAREVARHPLGSRIRDVMEAPDGTIWVLEDGRGRTEARLRKLVPAK